jgi:dienelactone hydrolase
MNVSRVPFGLGALVLLLLGTVLLWTPTAGAAEPLPGTKLLTEDGDLAAKMVAGMHTYLDREWAMAPEQRREFWKPDFSSPEKYVKSVEPNRQRLRKMLGVVDQRVQPNMEIFASPGEKAAWDNVGGSKLSRVRWSVLPGVDAEGLLLEPPPKFKKYIADVILLPDTDTSPEELCCLMPNSKCLASLLAVQGCRVLILPVLDRKDTFSGNPKLNRATNLPHREFVYRMAYEMGRTLIGYEVQKVLAAADWFQSDGTFRPLVVAGFGEGGNVATYAAALDTRFTSCLVSSDFFSRARLWEQPIDRNVWGLLQEFGDAELAMLVAPRKLLIDQTPTANWQGPVVGQPGRGGAAPGSLPVRSNSKVELDRIRKMIAFTWEPVVVNRGETFEALIREVGEKSQNNDSADFIKDGFRFPTMDYPLRKQRQKNQFDQLVSYTQQLWRTSEPVRKAFWSKADATSPEAWDKSCEWYRDYFHTEVIGKLPEPTMPLNPRTRQVYDEKTWTGHEVMLDVYPDVFAFGVLLLPRDLKPGEKRPVVVCQHGLEGTPRKTIDLETGPTYNQMARKLVELGYIVYAPQNPYYGENVFRQLQRKANPLKLSLFSFIIRQHQRTLDWLETLPNVDAKRIAFYGLSYGGKTAMRVPAVEKRYCLSICSGDFNEWIGKNVSVDLDRSYMWTREYEMYEFDLGNTFNYAEMAYLIAPRPFMVERGHDDPVGTDEMVAYEYAKVRYLYANRLKIPDRTTIEFFPGGHQINAKGTFEFLKKQLNYP